MKCNNVANRTTQYTPSTTHSVKHFRQTVSQPSKKFFTFNQSTFVSHLVCPPQCMLNFTKCIRSNGIGIFIRNIHSTSSFVPSASARTRNASAYRIPCENTLENGVRDCTGVLPMKIALKKSDEKIIEITRVHDDVKRRCWCPWLTSCCRMT